MFTSDRLGINARWLLVSSAAQSLDNCVLRPHGGLCPKELNKKRLLKACACHLEHLVQIPATPLLIYLPTNVHPGRHQVDWYTGNYEVHSQEAEADGVARPMRGLGQLGGCQWQWK